MIRVISIGTDRNIFNPESAVAKRMIEYGKVFGELHLVVFAKNSHGLGPVQLSSNVFAYPTQSSGIFGYIQDAVRIGKEIGTQIYFGQTVISTQDPFETGIAGVLLKKAIKAPLQIQIHTDFYNSGFYDGAILNWIRFEIARWIIPQGDAFRVVRKKIGQDLIKHFSIPEERISVLPIWVDIKGIHESEPENNLHKIYPLFETIFLTASRLTEEKRVDIILHAFAKVVKRFPSVGLVIVGDGPKKRELIQLAKKTNIQEHVVFEGWQKDTVMHMKTANLFVNASRFEGYGMSLVEAVAAMCPILTTNVGVVSDLFEDGRDAYICNHGDEQCFVNTMISFLENPSFQSAVAHSAYQKIISMAISHDEYLKQYEIAMMKAIQQ